MSRANINDADSVKALLEQLRSSSAWQNVTTPSSAELAADSETIPDVPKPAAAPADTASTLASLLAQLQQDNSSGWPPQAQAPPPKSDGPFRPADPRKIPVATSSLNVVPNSPWAPRNEPTSARAVPSTPLPDGMEATRDIRSLTFQQSLPLLAKLGEDPTFAELVTQMKQEQDSLERQLWGERREITKKYEEKVKVAKTKASMIGTGLSKHEVGMINAAFRKELEKLDVERVLPAWDGLISKQQATLTQRNVPTMFVTKTVADRERQHRVMQVLEGLVREEDS